MGISSNIFAPREPQIIAHFIVVYLVTWPLNGSEAEDDFVLIQTSLLFTYKSCCSHANYFTYTYEKHEVSRETSQLKLRFHTKARSL